MVEDEAGDANGLLHIKGLRSNQILGFNSCLLVICIQGEWMKQDVPVRKGMNAMNEVPIKYSKFLRRENVTPEFDWLNGLSVEVSE